MMTDAELQTFLGIANTKECAKIMASITPQQRALYDSMATIETEVELWLAGLGPKPAGVLIDMDRGRRRRAFR